MGALVSSAEGDRKVAAVDFHRRGIAAEGAVRSAFVVEAEEGGEVGLGLDLGGVALDDDLTPLTPAAWQPA
jgi:hypothetical protein